MNEFKLWYEKYKASNSPFKKIIGFILIILGFSALVTPFTPGSWLIFVGLEFLGFRLAIWDKIKENIFSGEIKNMHIKKIILALLIISIVTSAIILEIKNLKYKKIENPVITITPGNISYNIEGQDIVLTNGVNTTTNTKIFGANTHGDVNGDGQTDTAVILTQEMGGSGTFFYIAIALKTNTGYTGTNAVLIGDRIAPQTSQIQNGLIIVNYADRKIGEDFTVKPSEGKSLYLEYYHSTLVARPEAIQLTSPYPYQEIASPLIIIGQARGNWFFEASFPVILTDWDGKIIAQGIAQAQGEWMTENFVPFKATLTFTKPTYKNNGSLILKKDNPSGLPQYDQAYEIPVIFK